MTPSPLPVSVAQLLDPKISGRPGAYVTTAYLMYGNKRSVHKFDSFKRERERERERERASEREIRLKENESQHTDIYASHSSTIHHSDSYIIPHKRSHHFQQNGRTDTRGNAV